MSRTAERGSMEPRPTRREVVLLGSVGVLASLAGCSGGGDAPEDGGGTNGDTDTGGGSSGGTDGGTDAGRDGTDGGTDASEVDGE